MAGLIPEDILDKIRDDCPIEDVVGHFVPLQRKGGSYWGLCPFHSEKSPSFHVHPERQIFYCFGCQRGGNAFRFLMDREGMGFVEAVEWCATRIGLDLSRFLGQEDEADRRGPLLEATRWAADWFAERLKSAEGADARRYLQERAILPETIEEFGLGYAPAEGKRLSDAAKDAGFALETLLQSAILGRKDQRAPFAYFRSRLIFPIRGAAQKIHGFGGRILGPGEPKYLNSPETPIFRKRKILYALPEARNHLVRGKSALLVEGYMDALSLWQAGWKNSIATCGTAFGAEQAKVLRRYCDTVVLLFDGDRAGRKAAFRSADVALAGGLDVRIVTLPPGQDPADLVAAQKVDQLQDAIANAPDLVESMRLQVEEHGGTRPLVERALHHLQETIRQVPDPIRKELLRNQAADVFGVHPDVLKGGLSRPSRPQADRGDDAAKAPTNETDSPEIRIERKLLGLAMWKRSARHLLVDELGEDDFRHARTRAIFLALGELDVSVDAIRSGELPGLPEDCEPLVARILAELPEMELDAKAELQSHLESLRKMQQKNRAVVEREDLARLDREDPAAALARLLEKSQGKSAAPDSRAPSGD